MDNENYISPNKITKQYDITSGTLRRWSEAGKIRCLRPNGGKRIYNIEDIKKIFNKENKLQENKEKNNDDNLKEVFKILKKNIETENNIDSINYIENEINTLTMLINHLKENKN
jgi:DNA-binding transcriptional MerR regulator